MVRLAQLLVPLALVFASSAQAGGWASSGGEIFGDQHNPWFVRSTQVVNYCVRIDPTSFSATRATVQDVLSRAIRYWQTEFAKGGNEDGRGTFAVGTQSFQEVDCDAGVADIRFLFGYGTLDAEQIEKLADPTRYVGVAVRTDYDEENLRGRGFVYVSSDSGPHGYRNEAGTLVEQAWQNERLLQYTLIHELGHVFGFPHTGSGIMSEVFVDQILQKSLYEIFTTNPIEPFLFPDARLESCQLGPLEKQWFGLPADAACAAVDFSHGSPEIRVSSLSAPGGTPVPAGALKRVLPNIQDLRARPGIILTLTPKQKVYTPAETAFRSFMLGPNFEDYGAEATYVPANGGDSRTAYLRVTPSSFTLLGVENGKLKVVFNYDSLIGLKLTLIPNP